MERVLTERVSADEAQNGVALEVRRMGALLLRIPRRYRRVLVLREIEGLGIDRISDRLGRPERGVRKDLAHAYALLTRHLLSSR